MHDLEQRPGANVYPREALDGPLIGSRQMRHTGPGNQVIIDAGTPRIQITQSDSSRIYP